MPQVSRVAISRFSRADARTQAACRDRGRSWRGPRPAAQLGEDRLRGARRGCEIPGGASWSRTSDLSITNALHGVIPSCGLPQNVPLSWTFSDRPVTAVTTICHPAVSDLCQIATVQRRRIEPKDLRQRNDRLDTRTAPLELENRVRCVGGTTISAIGRPVIREECVLNVGSAFLHLPESAECRIWHYSSMADSVRLRVELFPADLEAFVDFYTRVLRFQVVEDRRNGDVPYVAVRRGECRIGAVAAWEAVDRRGRALPTGTEIVLEVDNLVEEETAVRSAGWSIDEPITNRPWGLQDFRLFDPDGYYIRITAVRH